MVYHVNDVFWHPQASIPCLWPLPRHRVLGGHSHTKSVCLPEQYANLVVAIALTAAVVLVVLVLVIDLVIAAAVVVVVSVVAVVLLRFGWAKYYTCRFQRAQSISSRIRTSERPFRR